VLPSPPDCRSAREEPPRRAGLGTEEKIGSTAWIPRPRADGEFIAFRQSLLSLFFFANGIPYSRSTMFPTGSS
jgi:hypothetical protein